MILVLLFLLNKKVSLVQINLKPSKIYEKFSNSGKKKNFIFNSHIYKQESMLRLYSALGFMTKQGFMNSIKQLGIYKLFQ